MWINQLYVSHPDITVHPGLSFTGGVSESRAVGLHFGRRTFVPWAASYFGQERRLTFPDQSGTCRPAMSCRILILTGNLSLEGRPRHS